MVDDDRPKCQHINSRPSTRLLEGYIVWVCKDCRHVRLNDMSEWLPGGSGILDRLRKLTKSENIKSTVEQALTSPITDPRWEQLF